MIDRAWVTQVVCWRGVCLAAIAGLVATIGLPDSAMAVSLAPLLDFGGGDGWLAPFENDYLQAANNERGLAYANGHVYFASHAGSPQVATVRILDPTTGSDLGGMDATGIGGGNTFIINALAVDGDGALYTSNLTTQSATSAFKVYKWATEVSAPVVVYTGDAGLPGARVGDTLAAIGSGANARVAAGFGATPVVAGNNSYTIIDPTASTATAIAIATNPPTAGDFRLGLTFTDATHVLGAQGSSIYRYTSFSGSTGTLIASPTIPDPPGATADRLLAYTTVAGTPILAVQSVGDAHVSIYNVTDPATPVFLASGRNVSGLLTANGNGSGQLAWGATTNNEDGSTSKLLYAMSTNAGIQAFRFTINEPVAAVAGDYNGNGTVDAADYVLWRNTLNQVVTAGTGADGDASGTVDAADYGFWRTRFGNVAGAGASAAVPEPGMFALVFVSLMVGLSGRRWNVRS
jgi:hypothetical protein